MKFADPKNDIAFKKIFGDERKTPILKSFLNSILGFSGDNKIKTITIANPHQIPHIEELKNTILDIKATDHAGNQFIVEMQIERDKYFAKRSLYYSSKSYVAQIEVSEDYKKLNKVYFIGILDFKMFDNSDYISKHLILDADTYKQELKDFEFAFIELPKFTTSLSECKTLQQKWIYFIKNTGRTKSIPEELASITEFMDAFNAAETYNWNRKELEIYDNLSLKISADRSVIITAREEGMKDEKIQITKKALLQGMDITTISNITGLSMDEINKLRELS